MVVQSTLLLLLDIVIYLILARAIISWFPITRGNAITQFIYQVTEPVLGPIRNLIQRSAIGSNMMIDFSPLIAWLLIDYLIKPLVEQLIRF